MKVQLAILMLAILPAFAQAADTCAFGETTGDLDEMLDYQGKGKIWYQGEQLTFGKPERINGLTTLEKEMILTVAGEDSKDEAKKKEAIEDFIGADGYITYFNHNSNDRSFIIVASYPGDNEYGMIFEVKKSKKVETFSIAAVISDGDLEDCKVK